MKRTLLFLIALAQLVLTLPLIRRMLVTAGGTTITPSANAYPEQVGVLIPVLNEANRLGPCLDGLIASGREVAKIVVIDGGSADGTCDLVRRYSQRDPRIELIETRSPDLVNGKAHGLAVGMQAIDTPWVLTIDADVRPQPGLVSALLDKAKREEISMLSIATRQVLSDWLDAIVHPAMLTTLIYRFGIPGHATARTDLVQANGQCLLIRSDLLDRLGGFERYHDVIAEDVAIARDAARLGERVGFYEAPGLVAVAMYANGRETIRNWSRSLPVSDRRERAAMRRELVSLALLQAAPIPMLVLNRGRSRFVQMVNGLLMAIRIGVLAGSRRAYANPGRWYWLSPLADVPVVSVLIRNARRRDHRWRGRIVRQGGA